MVSMIKKLATAIAFDKPELICRRLKVAINRNAKTVFTFQLDAVVCWRLGTSKA